MTHRTTTSIIARALASTLRTRARMSQYALLLAFTALATGCPRYAPDAETAAVEQADVERVVEAACGQCKFSMEGAGCDLAVRFDGQAYYTDGATIDEYGDAHGTDGFCLTVRQARVTGHVANGRFLVSAFELLPAVDE